MKKLLLATLLAAGTMVPMAAADFTVLFRDNPVENGSTITYDEYDVTVLDGGEAGMMYMWKVDPALLLVTDDVAPMTIHVKSITGVPIRLCAGGTCLEDPEITKDVENLKAGVPLNLQLDWEARTTNEPEIEIPAMEILVEIYYTSDPSNIFSFTLNMGGMEASGVESVTANEVNVVLKGKALYYDLAGTSQIAVYSLSGKTVLSQTVSGNGSISLEGLSKGIYLYRVSGKDQKAAKFILK